MVQTPMFRLIGYPISKDKWALLGVDVALFWSCFLTVAALRHNLTWALTYAVHAFFSISLICLIYVVVFYIGELYELTKDYRSQREVFNILLVCGAAFLASALVIYPVESLRISRKVFMYNGVFVAAAMVACRFALSAYQGDEGYKKRTLILGATDLARTIVEETVNQPRLDTNVAVLYDSSDQGDVGEIDGLDIIRARDAKLADVVGSYRVVQIILAIPLGSHDRLLRECFRLSHDGVEVVRGEDWFEQHTGRIPLKLVDDNWLLSAELSRPKFYYRKAKRLMDLGLSLVGIVLGAPVMAAVAAAIYMESGRPILFAQERVGYRGNPFQMFKFRTMVVDAEPDSKAQWTTPDDPRVTRVGRIVRKLRLDELPQLFNVWRGEMSLIGPRPERDVFVQEFLSSRPIEIVGRRREDAGRKVLLDRSQEALPYYSKRLWVQPGITGWAQVNYPYAGSFDENEIKLTYDLWYMKNLSFTLDCLILLRTVRVVLLGRGAR